MGRYNELRRQIEREYGQSARYVLLQQDDRIAIARCDPTLVSSCDPVEATTPFPTHPAGVILSALDLMSALYARYAVEGMKGAIGIGTSLDGLYRQLQGSERMPLATLGNDGIGDGTWLNVRGRERTRQYPLEAILG